MVGADLRVRRAGQTNVPMHCSDPSMRSLGQLVPDFILRRREKVTALRRRCPDWTVRRREHRAAQGYGPGHDSSHGPGQRPQPERLHRDARNPQHQRRSRALRGPVRRRARATIASGEEASLVVVNTPKTLYQYDAFKRTQRRRRG